MADDPIRRIAISTGGGDAPGLNAVIRAAVLAALGEGWECVGIRDGYNGLLDPDTYDEGGLMPLGRREVRGITHLGGTIIGTTNRGDPLAYPVRQEDGTVVEVDRSRELVDAFAAAGIDALIAIGGDGSMRIAGRLSELGLPVIGVPKTIDNDLEGTSVTFGFDTAVTFATECIDRLHTTAESHDRLMVVEVMGRYAGWIALHAGLAGSADAILIPEIPYDLDSVAAKIAAREAAGQHFSIVVVAEGAHPKDGERSVIDDEPGRGRRLGGIGQRVAYELAEMTGKETRTVVLGHLLRGGGPTTRDRILSLRFGAAAIRALCEGHAGCMVALDPPDVRYVPLEQVTGRMKCVPVDSDTVRTVRDLGTSLGD
ncbi:MAG TPA: ATP-dependent 6-phosphofructokinase [Gemmatimonadota bacterium]|nr:ATP-dependent 6-phosphofructokinase [Gemmatimonadota bacterium]